MSNSSLPVYLFRSDAQAETQKVSRGNFLG